MNDADLTFQPGPVEGVVLKSLSPRHDDRGWLVEMFRSDELNPADVPRMAYFSETLPGVARGPHEHRRQTDLFVFVGPGDFKLYCWDTRSDSPTRGNRLSVAVGQSNMLSVLIPPGVVHAYKNVGLTPAVMLNCPNQLYAGEGRGEPVDEVRYEDTPNCPFLLD